MATKTTRRTTYIVQGFWREGRGFRSGQARRIDSEPQARRYGAELAQQAPGVTVVAVEVDETVDYCGEPLVLVSYGEVPDLAA